MPTIVAPPEKRVLSLTALLDRVPASRTSIWRWERAGLFPGRVQIGPNRVGWIEADVDEWLEQRKASHGHNS